MASVQEELNKFTDEELTRFQGIALAKLAQSLKAQNLVLTGDTLRSLQGEVLQATGAGVSQLLLAFADSGRIKEFSRLNRRKLPPQAALEQYVRDVGVEKFHYVPGYPGRTIPTEQIAVRRIAWGLRVHLLQQNEQRPAKWFSKPFYGLLNGLIDTLVTRYQQATGDVIGGNFAIVK